MDPGIQQQRDDDLALAGPGRSVDDGQPLAPEHPFHGLPLRPAEGYQGQHGHLRQLPFRRTVLEQAQSTRIRGILPQQGLQLLVLADQRGPAARAGRIRGEQDPWAGSVIEIIGRPLRRECIRDPRNQSVQGVQDALIEGGCPRVLLARGGTGEGLDQTLEIPVQADLQPFDQARELRIDTPAWLAWNQFEPVRDPVQPHLAVE